MLKAMHELLTTQEMYEADRLTIAGGMTGIDLMENAGAGVTKAIIEKWPYAARFIVLCGPGNNGGDGFIIARLLVEQGLSVRLMCTVSTDKLTGDAAIAATRFGASCENFSTDRLGNCDVIVDCLFGAGLTRDINGLVGEVIERINQQDIPVVSVDVPSGIDGDTGFVRGVAINADLTVTFFRRKTGHLLMPGCGFCGEVKVVQIGVPDTVLDQIKPENYANEPSLWKHHLPVPGAGGHKYHRGHVLCVSGGYAQTGAIRLAARGALRAGAGLVSIAGEHEVVSELAAHLTAMMVYPISKAAGLEEVLQDRRLNAVVIGPGLGIGKVAGQKIHVALKSGAQVVLDADALTSFNENISNLATVIPFGVKEKGVRREVVMTPHSGEFDKLFDDDTLYKEFSYMSDKSEIPLVERSKLNRTRRAAKTTCGIVVHKGPDTVIAGGRIGIEIDGRAAINTNAPAWLATAGSGDVLAGIIAGLMGQGMTGFEASCAGVWMHSEAARIFGPGLIAEDLPETLPKVWQKLL